MERGSAFSPAEMLARHGAESEKEEKRSGIESHNLLGRRDGGGGPGEITGKSREAVAIDRFRGRGHNPLAFDPNPINGVIPVSNPSTGRGARTRRFALESLEPRVVMDAGFRWASPIAASAPTTPQVLASASAYAPDGSLYVAGSGRGTLTFGASAGSPALAGDASGNWSAFLARYGADGSLQFARPLPDGGVGGFASVESLATDGAGNLYLGARTKDSRAVLAKLDSEGRALWVDAIPSASPVSRVNDISFVPNGDVVTVGTFVGQNVDFDPGPGVTALSSTSLGGEAFVARYRGDGSLVWAITTAGVNSSGVVGNAVASDSSGNLYVAGGFNGTVDFNPAADLDLDPTKPGPEAGYAPLTTAAALDPFYLKLSGDGRLIWGRSLKQQATGASAATLRSEATGLAVAGSGVYVTGSIQGTVLAHVQTAVDASGNQHAVANVTATGGAGGSAFLLRADTDVQRDSDGVDRSVRWIRVVGGGASNARDVMADSGGNAILAGSYDTIAGFGDAPDQVLLTARGRDLYLAKYAADGTIMGASGVLSSNDPNSSYAQGILIASALTIKPGSGDLGIAGSYSGGGGASALPVKLGSVVLPEMGRQGNAGAGAAGNAFVARVAVPGDRPRLLSTPSLAPQDDTAPLGDFVTLVQNPRIVGRATPGVAVDLVDVGANTLLQSVTAGADGQYVLTAPAIASGVKTYAVRIRDAGQYYPSAPFAVNVFAPAGGGGGTPGGGGGSTGTGSGGGTSTGSGTGGGSGTASSSGPSVQAVRLATLRIRKRGPMKKVFQVDFTGQFSAAVVQSLGNYRLVSAGRDRRFGTRDDRNVPFGPLAYNAASRSVTLTPRMPLPARMPMRLTIAGLAGGQSYATDFGPRARG